MEQVDETEMLDLMVGPVFFVKNGIIVKLNEAASRLFLREGLEITKLLISGSEDYAVFSSGLLCVTLSLYGQSWGATVRRIAGMDLFTLDHQFDSDELRILALAAQELRTPLSNAMLAAQQLSGSDNPPTAKLNRSLHQLLRIIGNMSDASGCSPMGPQQILSANAFFSEIICKVSALADKNTRAIPFSRLEEDILFPAYPQILERAVLNMFSNALKFSSGDSPIRTEIHKCGSLLRFSVVTTGYTVSEEILTTLFRRYLRSPSIEDCRHGIGLGMVMIRNAASAHKGAVLADTPVEGEFRISLTLSTESTEECALHTPTLLTDYAGEQDHALLELSEVLPAELYPM